MCVRRLSKKAVAFEVQIMLPVKDSSQSSSHLKLSCDQRAHQASLSLDLNLHPQ